MAQLVSLPQKPKIVYQNYRVISLQPQVKYQYSNPEECVQMGKRGRCYILEHLTREVGTRKYIGVIESIVGH